MHLTLGMFLKFLSWVRVVPASIAGKLMVNDVIYAKGIYLDRYLWQIRQVMMQFALFALGFILLSKILVAFVSMSDPNLFSILSKK